MYKVEIFFRCILGGGICVFMNIKYGKNISRIGICILEKKEMNDDEFCFIVILVVFGWFSEDCLKYKVCCFIWECIVYCWYNVGKNYLY